MALKMQTGQHAIGLDVIVEEEISHVMEDLDISPQKHCGNNSVASTTSTTCTFTLRKYKCPKSNQPQFLHAGQWPHTGLIDYSVIIAAEQDDDIHVTESRVTYEYSSQDGIDTEMLPLSKAPTRAPITADQLSMVMDYWDPDQSNIPSISITKTDSGLTSISMLPNYSLVTSTQQSLFVREIMDEHLTRSQTVEYLEELEDYDNAIEVVAVLESYRQTGWAREMVKAFPNECWSFWACSRFTTPTSAEQDEADDQDLK